MTLETKFEVETSYYAIFNVNADICNRPHPQLLLFGLHISCVCVCVCVCVRACVRVFV